MQNYANIPDHPTVLMEFVRLVRVGEIYILAGVYRTRRRIADRAAPQHESGAGLEKKKLGRKSGSSIFFSFTDTNCNFCSYRNETFRVQQNPYGFDYFATPLLFHFDFAFLSSFAYFRSFRQS